MLQSRLFLYINDLQSYSQLMAKYQNLIRSISQNINWKILAKILPYKKCNFSCILLPSSPNTHLPTLILCCSRVIYIYNHLSSLVEPLIRLR